MVAGSIKIFLACDHGGFEVKEQIKKINFTDLDKTVEINDVGTYSTESVHYPIFAKKAIDELIKYIPNEKGAEQHSFGIFICTTGIGMSMVANREVKIRAALCHSVEEAKLTREHNNANVLCIGAKFTDLAILEDIVKTFLTTEFLGGRHETRINMY